MIKNYVCISNPCTLTVKNDQLQIVNRESGVMNSVPLSDIAVLELDNPAINLNSYLLSKAAQENIVIISTQLHLPIGVNISLYSNSLHTRRLKEQITCNERTINRMWQYIIQTKIQLQAENLKQNNKNFVRLIRYSEQVLTGDKSNREAIASAYYWKELFGSDFVRTSERNYPNNMLNYGYAIVRTSMARAIVAAGFHPAIGLHHQNQYNAFCLADDLMEVYRPFVDSFVYQKLGEFPADEELTKTQKEQLISIIYCDVKIGGQTSPMQIAIQKTANSLINSYSANKNQLLLPDV